VPTLESDPDQGVVSPVLVQEREIGRVDGQGGGPTLVVLGGVHGNEPAGIHASRRVIERLGAVNPALVHGSFVTLAGDMAAINHPDPATRYIDHDLNRLCTRERFAETPDTSAEHREMFGLFDALGREHARCAALGREMVLVDLHTTSAPSRPIVALEDTLAARAVVRHLPLPRYLGMEEELGGLVFDAATQRFGCVAFLIEGGQHDDPLSIRVHEAAIWTLLSSLGVLDLRALGDAPFDADPGRWLRRAAGPKAGLVYDLRHLEPITSEDFEILRGIGSGSRVRAGSTRVATQGGRELIAPMDGEVFLPNMQPYKRIGDDGYFIVRRVSTGWINLSARLRTKRWIHALIERLPGVHRHRSGVLLVESDLAAVLKRQVFHLLGYRLERHDDTLGGRGLARVARGIVAFARAIVRAPIRREVDPQDPGFWVVRRRRLDLDARRAGPRP